MGGISSVITCVGIKRNSFHKSYHKLFYLGKVNKQKVGTFASTLFTFF